MNVLIVISGPTAIGKTKLAIHIAGKLDTEIISADSRQFYKELNIGVAKPSAEQLKTVKHHFINNVSITDKYSVGKYEKEVISFLELFFKKKNNAVMVGGSGLYIKAVSEGLNEYPDIDKTIRENLKKLHAEEGIKALQDKLKKADNTYFAQVDINNPHRLIRALEVYLATGKPFSSFQSQAGLKSALYRNFIPIKIGLNIDREKLYEKINQRVDEMIKHGLIEEVKKIYPYKNLNSLQTVGYKELMNYLDGKIDLDSAIELIKKNTRNYAKRQLTWFRKDKEIKWFHPEEKENILEYLRNEIKIKNP